jgi:FtsP/CotA-like multicopper oxidase with cupredoxin domain
LQRFVITALLAAIVAFAGGDRAWAIVSTLNAPALPAVPEVTSRAGVATLELRAALDRDGRPAFFWHDREVAPTIRVHPGDRIRIRYVNALPEICGLGMVSDSNLHFHGLSSAPVAPGDEVIATNVAPHAAFDYTLVVARDQPPGLYWYHPHPHRLANWEIGNGMSGAIVVEGIADVVPATAGLRERVIVLRDPPYDPSVAAAEARTPAPAAAASGSAAVRPPDDDGQGTTPCGVESEGHPTINGLPSVSFGIRPGERQLWRILNAAGTRVFDLAVSGARFVVVALDGVPLADAPGAPAQRVVDHLLLPPGARAEVVVTGPRHPQLLLSRCVRTGSAGEPNPGALLGELVDDGGSFAAPVVHGPLGLAPAHPVALPKPAATRTIRLSEDARGFYLDRRAYAPTDPPAIVARAGTIERWQLVNESDELHVFHIHQVHFLVDGAWHDTVNVLPRGRLTVLVDFRNPRVRGTFLYHCHLTDHEDGGMMAKIRVI